MAQHRHTVKISLASKQQTLLRVEKDPSLRVMVFCAAEGPGRQDILFPHQSEIKVNGGDVKANLRGLKNKPGSTRPVDITKDLRLNASYTNNYVEMTYALTNKACATPEVSIKCPLSLHFIPTIFFPSRRDLHGGESS